MEKYFSFKGASTRSEYWAVQIIVAIMVFVMFTVAWIFSLYGGSGPALILAGMALIFFSWANLSLVTRRCRDAGINVWWTLAYVLPYVGFVVWIVLGCIPTEQKAADVSTTA